MSSFAYHIFPWVVLFCFSFFLTLFVGSCTLYITATPPVLTDWFHVEHELHQTAQGKLLFTTQTFVVIHATVFVVSGSQ